LATARNRFIGTHSVIVRHRVSPLASPMTGSGGRSSTPRHLLFCNDGLWTTGCPACAVRKDRSLRISTVWSWAGVPSSAHPRLAAEAGVNYLIGQFAFGDLRQEEVQHSADIFARNVIMPDGYR
jgi:hypothetical protein